MSDQAELSLSAGGNRFVQDMLKSLNTLVAKDKKNKRELTKYKILYHKVNLMLIGLGASGEIDARDQLVEAVNDALHEIDGGVYNGKI